MLKNPLVRAITHSLNLNNSNGVIYGKEGDNITINSGTCTDQANGYNCVCAEGFAGPQCAIIGDYRISVVLRAQLVFIGYRFFVHWTRKS